MSGWSKAGRAVQLPPRRPFAQRPAYHRPEVTVALDSIRDAFAATDRIGARSYARFVATDIRDEPQLERRAVGAIAEFIAALPDSN